MKAKLSRNLLEAAISRCFDACEKKATEAITQFEFSGEKLTLSSKGSITFYEETISVIESQSDCVFSLKTAAVLEFTKYITSEDLILVFDDIKKSCMVSSTDKKSKIAFQTLEILAESTIVQAYPVVFKVENPHELISKLNHASKFCSAMITDYPLTAIHCLIEPQEFKIKAANGPIFYSTSLEVNANDTIEVYLPKKSSSIIKSIFSDNLVEKCSIGTRSVLFESQDCKLTIYIEKSEKDSFPTTVSDWLYKDSAAKIKVSAHEFSKTLRFLNGIFNEASVHINIKDNVMILESKELTLAAKENVTVEECDGEADSSYGCKNFLDCLDSLQSPWVNLHFINFRDGFYLCKISSDKTLILLCPTTS